MQIAKHNKLRRSHLFKAGVTVGRNHTKQSLLLQGSDKLQPAITRLLQTVGLARPLFSHHNRNSLPIESDGLNVSLAL